MLQQAVELGEECRVLASVEVRALETLDRMDERLRHEAAAEFAEIAARVGVAANRPERRP